MYDTSLLSDTLQNIENSLQELLEWTSHINSVNDFLSSTQGVILLNAVCMRLLAVGEEVKTIDKHTNKTLLSLYPSIPWKNVMGLRDVIAHHYFELNANAIFSVLHIDIPPLLHAIRQIRKDVENR
jgi:uncharacterized protein with HEPN domain